jgi:hypothetical protein
MNGRLHGDAHGGFVCVPPAAAPVSRVASPFVALLGFTFAVIIVVGIALFAAGLYSARTMVILEAAEMAAIVIIWMIGGWLLGCRFELSESAIVKIFAAQIPIRSVLLTFALLAYITLSLFSFFTWIAPSLDGRTDQHIGADSASYISYADLLRESPTDASLIAVLYSYSFPNTLLLPVLLALAIKSTFAMVVVNYAILILAVVLLKKTFTFSVGAFVSLLLLNATATISLLTVNKEIVDLLGVSLFLFARCRHRNGALLLALLIALLNRFEVCAVMLAFMLVESRFNPWRKRRAATLIALTIALSILLPLLLPALAPKTLDADSEIANHGTITLWFNNLELHYLYAVAVIPKLGAMFFAELIDFSNWRAYGSGDIANTYILLSNNIANAIVCCVLAWKKRFVSSSTVIYFAMLGCILMTVSLSKQPRYLFFAYALMCLEAAREKADKPSWWTVPPLFGMRARRTRIV